MNNSINVRTAIGLLVFSTLLVLCLASFAVYAASSNTVTIQTNSPSYSGGTQTIRFSGTVTPAPAVNGTYIGVAITAPDGSLVYANEYLVSLTSGAYNGSCITGPTFGAQGTYTIKVNYNGITASTDFQFGNATSTSSQSTSSTTVTITTSSTVSTSSSASSTSTSSTSTTSSSQISTTTSQSQQTTTTTSQQTQTTSSTTSSSTASRSSGSSSVLIVGAVVVVVAAVASAFALMMKRKK